MSLHAAIRIPTYLIYSVYSLILYFFYTYIPMYTRAYTLYFHGNVANYNPQVSCWIKVISSAASIE